MSDSELLEQPGSEIARGRIRQSAGSRPKPWLAVALVVVIAACVIVLVRTFGDRLPVPVTYVMFAIFAGFALVGIIAIVSLLTGFVHLGRAPQQRAFFDNMMDGLQEACVVTDKRGRVIYSNVHYRQMLEGAGFSRLVGFENLYAGYPDLADKIYRLSQAAKSGNPGSEEFRLANGSSAAGAKAGGPTWVRISVAQIGARLGRTHALWRYRDISETRSSQEAAFSHLQYIINYLDHAPAGFFSTRGNGEIAYLNATLASWLDLDLQDTTDGNVKLSDFIDSSDAQMLLDLKPANDQSRTSVFDIDLKRKSGGFLPVRIIHRTDFNSDGVAQPSRSLVLDMRDEAVSGDSNHSNVKFSRLVNSAPFGIAEIGAGGEIISCNAAFVELGSVATRGSLLSEVVVESDRQELADAIVEARQGQSGRAVINVSFSGDGENTANIILARLDHESERAETVYAFVVDTSTHSSLEEQLAQSQKMQAVGQLAGGVAHDFNNVLTAIIGFSDLLLATHRPTDPSFADIMNIKQNANRAANLVRQLLAFSRRQTLRPEVICLSDVMSDLGNLLGRLLGETVKLDMVYGRDLGLVRVDLNQFEQVVINLAVNARDAMDMKGKLTIRTSNVSVSESKLVAPNLMPEGEYVLCEVIDTGSGMPPEVVAKIYEPFFSTKDVGKGTGLGLSTVYGIVKQTGGFIFCESQVGKGTTFKVYLPRVYRKENEVVEEKPQIDVKKADMTGDATILLVEDEDAVRMFASRALSGRGYEVLEADSGETALEVMENYDGEIDLVLSDVVMPEMDGPTMLKEMRKRGVMTKFIFISGYAEDAFEKNLEGADDFAFLAKPFSLKQLTGAVKDALRS